MSKEAKNKNIKLLKSLGEKIRNKRIELKLSQGNIADLLDVSYTQIYHYEIGRSEIPITNLLKLCEFFNVDIDYFVSDIKKEKQNESSVAKYSENPELEKEIMMLKEIYNYNDEDLIYIAKNNIELAYGLLKKQRKQKGDTRSAKKKVAKNN
jgi:transcriptional regulator with XRE-family HTH domain